MPWAYRIILASSGLLSVCWIVYLFYMGITNIDKQSVFLGPITFYTALLFAVSLVALLAMVVAWGFLAYRDHKTLRRSTYIVFAVVVLIGSVYAATELMVIRAIG